MEELTRKEQKWIERLDKVLSQMPEYLYGFLYNGEQIDFFREGYMEIDAWHRKPIATIKFKDNCRIDGGG